MNFKPKLVAFDLDGTLAESKQRVSAKMGELLTQLLEVMPVAVMSGASFKQFETQLLPVLPANEVQLKRLYLFPVNAAVCFIFKQEKWQAHYDHSLNPGERARIMQAIEEALEETGLTNIPERKEEWGEQIEDRVAQITFSALGQRAPIEQKQRWDPAHEKRRPLYEALVRRLPDFSIAINAATSIDITKKGISKAYGIRRLIELTSISISEMLYVGDALEEGGNDAVVIQTGVKIHPVFGPEETTELITTLLRGVKHTALV